MLNIFAERHLHISKPVAFSIRYTFLLSWESCNFSQYGDLIEYNDIYSPIVYRMIGVHGEGHRIILIKNFLLKMCYLMVYYTKS